MGRCDQPLDSALVGARIPFARQSLSFAQQYPKGTFPVDADPLFSEKVSRLPGAVGHLVVGPHHIGAGFKRRRLICIHSALTPVPALALDLAGSTQGGQRLKDGGQALPPPAACAEVCGDRIDAKGLTGTAQQLRPPT